MSLIVLLLSSSSLLLLSWLLLLIKSSIGKHLQVLTCEHAGFSCRELFRCSWRRWWSRPPALWRTGSAHTQTVHTMQATSTGTVHKRQSSTDTAHTMQAATTNDTVHIMQATIPTDTVHTMKAMTFLDTEWMYIYGLGHSMNVYGLFGHSMNVYGLFGHSMNVYAWKNTHRLFCFCDTPFIPVQIYIMSLPQRDLGFPP